MMGSHQQDDPQQRQRAAQGPPADPTVDQGPPTRPALAPNAVRLGPETYFDPSAGRASFVPMNLAMTPVAPVGWGSVAASGDAGMMRVQAESLDAFRNQVRRAYQEAFGAASSPAAPARFAGETTLVPRQLGELTETQRVHGAYQPLQQRMGELLGHLDQLILDLHTRIGRTNEQYQFSEQAASDAVNAVREH
jgi:hypothetical protein